MIINFKKNSIILIVVASIFFSGLAGFGGSYLAKVATENNQKENVSQSNAYQSIVQTSTVSSESTLSISDIASLASQSVVEIMTETVQTGNKMRQYISEGAGSGVIIRDDGYIVTNNHVIDGASKITLTVHDGKSYEAVLVGSDVETDLAVVKIDAQGLQPAVFGDSDELIVGELAVAIGNPLGELGGTVTEGIISALNRDIIIDGEKMNLLQTSAAVNPGNSGGGLFNQKGELIGIVNAKSSGDGIEGLGFAIPVNTVKQVVEQIMEFGYVRGRIEIGATIVDITDTQTAMMYGVQRIGVYVLEVMNDNVALKPGDRIISVDGIEVNSSLEIKDIIDKYQVGDTVKFLVQRERNILELEIVLREASN